MTHIEIDPDVHSVAEFMQTQIAASRLVSVASQLAAIAPLLWGDYERSTVQVLRLVAEPIAAPTAPVASSG